MPRIDRVLRRPRLGQGTAGARGLLSQSDITYVGYHTLHDLVANKSIYAQGPTVRYVSGVQKFVLLDYVGAGGVGFRPQEITLTGNPTTGGTVTNGTSWTNQSQIWGASYAGSGGWAGNGGHNGIWWEDGVGLWWNSAGDYPQGEYTMNNVMTLSLRQLADNGTCSGFRGHFGIGGIGTRAHYGGMRRIPAWFVTAYSSGRPYLTGFGGYSSLLAQGLGAGLGLFVAAIPDPLGYTDNLDFFDTTANIPGADVRIISDPRPANTGTDWRSGSYAARTYDRGVRATTGYTTFYENGATTPRVSPSTNWQNVFLAAGDPLYPGRWTWGDSYFGTLNWIDNDAGTRNKHGIAAIASLGGGDCWYESSTLNSASRIAEIHLYDPADFASSLGGSLDKWKVRPYAAWDITAQLNSIVNEFGDGGGGTSEPGAIVGACFDPAVNRLYALHQVRSTQNASLVSRMHIWDVAA